MGAFLSDEQEGLARDIAAQLIARGSTVAVAEATTGGLISAALLSVTGASRYYAGGAILYTLGSRTALGGVPAEAYLEVLNATNRRNVMEIGYSEDYSEEEPVYQLPRIPFIGIVARF